MARFGISADKKNCLPLRNIFKYLENAIFMRKSASFISLCLKYFIIKKGKKKVK